jgi:hypothetical protein
MPYTSRIKTLEESYRLVDIQISNLEKSDPVDVSKLDRLKESKNNYLTQLRELRRLQYEDSQRVDFDDR